jgi:hypothetical protein
MFASSFACSLALVRAQTRRSHKAHKMMTMATSSSSSSSSSRAQDAQDAANAPSSVGFNRRQALTAIGAAASTFVRAPAAFASSAVEATQASYFAATSKAAAPERWYPYWWALPLAPYGSKTTAVAEAVPGEVWTFDQLQGLLDVLVNVRMTVARLEGGGLWVHNPVAPTPELVKEMRALEAKYGKVKHIVVGSAAIEHKIYSGPFSKAFPNADVWLPPKNWTFPVDVPLESYVPFYPEGSPKTLPETSLNGEPNVPWANEIEHAVLQVGGSSLRNFKDPWFVDTAFYLKRTKTVVLTDVMEKVSQQAPPVCQINPQPLLVRAMDEPDKVPANTSQARSDGWGKTVLFGLLFNPAAVEFKFSGNLGKDLLDGFVWDPSWREDFDALVARPMFVPPILAVLAFPRRRDEVKRWSNIVTSWDFESIIPSHLDGPFAATPEQFTAAIDFALMSTPYEQFGRNAQPLLDVDALSVDLKSLEVPKPLSPELVTKPAPPAIDIPADVIVSSGSE